MWGTKTQESKAVKEWHSKAMLVDPKKTRITIIWNETQSETKENLLSTEQSLETTEPNLVSQPKVETTEPNLTKTPSINETIESPTTDLNLESVESHVAEAPDTCETTDSEYDLATLDQESLNVKFLRALEKTRGIWDNDKQFTQIVQKMQKGKNLKRKEFDKVHLYLREYCHHN